MADAANENITPQEGIIRITDQFVMQQGRMYEAAIRGKLAPLAKEIISGLDEFYGYVIVRKDDLEKHKLEHLALKAE